MDTDNRPALNDHLYSLLCISVPERKVETWYQNRNTILYAFHKYTSNIIMSPNMPFKL